jgi:kinesin family member C1
VHELEAERNRLTLQMDNFREKISEAKEQNAATAFAAEEARRTHEIEIDDLERKNRYDLEDIRDQHRIEIDRLRRDAISIEEDIRRETRDELDRLIRTHREALEELEGRLKRELNDERVFRTRQDDEHRVLVANTWVGSKNSRSPGTDASTRPPAPERGHGHWQEATRG